VNIREWPLVVFTLTGQAAAGLAVVLLLPGYAPAGRAADPLLHSLRMGAALGVFILAGLAAAASLLHLGRASRAPRSVVNAGTSWLSREVIALLVFLAAAAVLVFAERRGTGAGLRTILAYLTAAAGGVFIFCMAKIYMLPTVLEWNTPATPAAFFSSALVLGALLAPFVLGFSARGVETNLPLVTLVIMGTAILVALLYTPRFGLLAKKEAFPPFRPDPNLPAWFAGRIALLALAILLWVVSIVIPGAAVAASWAALAAAVGSVVLGRLLFYSLPSGL
jgi:anaerobic dimethyl sulfoxide reductase subunit C (anchor subunit)